MARQSYLNIKVGKQGLAQSGPNGAPAGERGLVTLVGLHAILQARNSLPPEVQPQPTTMPFPASAESELQSSVRKLSIGVKGRSRDVQRPRPPGRGPQAKSEEELVAESWEDEADSSEDDAEGCQLKQQGRDSAIDSPVSGSASPSINAEGPLDPPPTPISPATSRTSPPPSAAEQGSPGRNSPLLSDHMAPAGSRSGPGPARRPEKQTAVAGRMIAGALGIRAPKRTPEQRAYDRAVKEQEIKRRDREKNLAAKEKEEEERAKAAIWDE